jgi:hypothetical protein
MSHREYSTRIDAVIGFQLSNERVEEIKILLSDLATAPAEVDPTCSAVARKSIRSDQDHSLTSALANVSIPGIPDEFLRV